MITKTIEKGNWSGEQADIKIFKNKVCLYGVCGQEKWESFNIKIQHKKDFTSFSVHHKEWQTPLIIGYLNNNTWYAQANLQRENKCLYTAIAQVLYNIL